MESTCTAVYMSPHKYTMREEDISLKVLVIEVQIATSSRFLATVGCFFVLHLLVNTVIIMAISSKGSKAYFHSNTIFLLLETTRVIVHLSMTLIKSNIKPKYLMKNVMGFPSLDMSSSAFCSVQDN